jgi:glucose/arabinose dehydrogenase/mono/diheme cytochrome c family protein
MLCNSASFQSLVVTVLSLYAFSVYGGLADPLVRVENKTLTFPLAPPAPTYVADDALAGVFFQSPVGLAYPPGETNRLFVIERGGTIAVVTNLAKPNRTVFLDLTPVGIDANPEAEGGLLGLAFHPGYATNGYFYVFYSLASYTSEAGTGLHQRVSRFEAVPPNANRADIAAERPIITQFDESSYHNGGDIHFGPDGYLYVAVGDEGQNADTLNNGQKIDKDFFSGILRIDVDARPENLEPNPHAALGGVNWLPYRVPADNPWIGATEFAGQTLDPSKVRTEFFAVGLRNPWRMSFDPENGTLYCGDVGQWVREEINIIERGGNYGWPALEGTIPGPKPNLVPAGTPMIPPLHEYLHSYSGFGDTNGNSVIGGVVYRGQSIPELRAYYIFGDFFSGNIWAFTYDGGQKSDFKRIASESRMAGFGTDPRNGDLLWASLSYSQIRRLARGSTSGGQNLPPTLAETGAFRDLLSLTVQPGIVGYSINTPFWSDHAQKRRWFSIPDTNLGMTFYSQSNWITPTGSVWIKHFELVTNELTGAKTRLETRFLVQAPGGVYGVTYRWDGTGTNATLVPESGMAELFQIVTPTGLVRTQQWVYPSRSACLSCHTPLTGGILGFNTAQLNRDHTYDSSVRTNQLQALFDAGYFHPSARPIPHDLPRLAAATDLDSSLEYRARSYLDANCSSCHRPGGSAQSIFDARFSVSTKSSGLLDGQLRDVQGDPQNRTIVPGSLSKSMILKRMSVRGPTQMPPLASSELDQEGLRLLTAWIQSADIKARASYESWQRLYFGGTNGVHSFPNADADGDDMSNEEEFLAGTDPRIGGDRLDIQASWQSGQPVLVVKQPANRSILVEQRDSLDDTSPWVVVPVPPALYRFPTRSQIWKLPIETSGSAQRYYRVGSRSL